MKVIFIADVPSVAMAGQTREVANGYARNFLFPRKLAVLASSSAAANIEVHLKKVAKLRAIEEAEMAELAARIKGVEITLKAKVGEKGKLYGSVTSHDVADALGKEIAREIDKRKVELPEPIRQEGVYDITVRFTHDINAVFAVTVMSDAEGAERPVRAAKAEAPAEEAKEAKPEKAEKKEKKAKKPKKEKAPEEPEEATKEVEPTAEEKVEKAEKPAKEKKAKAAREAKPEKAEKPAEEQEKPAKEARKEKKSKAKKTEEAVEENKE